MNYFWIENIKYSRLEIVNIVWATALHWQPPLQKCVNYFGKWDKHVFEGKPGIRDFSLSFLWHYISVNIFKGTPCGMIKPWCHVVSGQGYSRLIIRSCALLCLLCLADCRFMTFVLTCVVMCYLLSCHAHVLLVFCHLWGSVIWVFPCQNVTLSSCFCDLAFKFLWHYLLSMLQPFLQTVVCVYLTSIYAALSCDTT